MQIVKLEGNSLFDYLREHKGLLKKKLFLGRDIYNSLWATTHETESPNGNITRFEWPDGSWLVATCFSEDLYKISGMRVKFVKNTYLPPVDSEQVIFTDMDFSNAEIL